MRERERAAAATADHPSSSSQRGKSSRSGKSWDTTAAYHSRCLLQSTSSCSRRGAWCKQQRQQQEAGIEGRRDAREGSRERERERERGSASERCVSQSRIRTERVKERERILCLPFPGIRSRISIFISIRMHVAALTSSCISPSHLSLSRSALLAPLSLQQQERSSVTMNDEKFFTTQLSRL